MDLSLRILKRALQVIKSFNRDNINNFCLCLKYKQKCQIIPSYHVSNLRYRAPKPKNYMHLTKSPKRDNIYKLCLHTPEEHKYLILPT